VMKFKCPFCEGLYNEYCDAMWCCGLSEMTEDEAQDAFVSVVE
jgi:hypothetical protein